MSSTKARKGVAAASLPIADIVDAQLARYRSMRDFHQTAEPAGGKASGKNGALPFCIQKHAASHLHYDFRLGWAGVLKSWAVAKGPSYVPADRRLAVEVEDHPIEYGRFEGIIPAGQYGGGTVMLWDEGSWEPQPGFEDVDQALRAGSLKFVMHGRRIEGKWTLVRMGGRAAQERKPNWLLIKEHDAFERGPGDPVVTDSELTSVATGRTMEEIASNRDHVWNSKETAGAGQAWFRKEPSGPTKEPVSSAASHHATSEAEKRNGHAGTPTRASRSSRLRKLPQEQQPSFVKPQLALETEEPPEEDGWLYELKLDGYRIQAHKRGSTVTLLTRSGLDWTYRVPSVAKAVAKVAVENITLDGEVVVLAPDGTTNFADLQASFQEGAKNPLTYFCFDVLHAEGRNPRDMPLRARKELLAELLQGATSDALRLCEHLEGSGKEIFRKACELHAEGVIGKRVDAPYVSGRGTSWFKLKCLHEQEFVVGGFTPSSEGPDRIGSLLLGYFEDGRLVYAGRAGTGYTQSSRRSLRQQLRPLEKRSTSFGRIPSAAKKDALWVEPTLVVQVRFASWTAEQLVRQAAFLGLREDKAADEVHRDESGPTPKRGRQRAAPKAASMTKDQPSATMQKSALETAEDKSGDWSGFADPRVRLTHPDKVVDIATGVTKRMLAQFYAGVAERMLPHVAGRPLSLVRCPEGSEKPCFYQKHVNHMLPPGVHSVAVPDKKTGVKEPYITLASKEALVGLAQMGVLEVHPWASRNDELEHADRVIFDLDPDEALPWEVVAAAAEEVRRALLARGLRSFLKTTGGKGLHLVAPIDPVTTWDEVKVWARQFVVSLEKTYPERYLTVMTKAARKGRIYLDYLRNERGATAVSPYSPRARRGLPVSLPLAWNELKAEARPQFSVVTFPAWQHRLRTDPWKTMAGVRQRLT